MKKMIAIIINLTFLVCALSVEISHWDQTDFYKQFIKDLDFGVETGYCTIESIDKDASNNNLYYQMVYKKGTNSKAPSTVDPFMIWLNGGPGCASQANLYGDLGPFHVKQDPATQEFTIDIRATSWNKYATILFLDQPFGAGFAWSDSTNIVNSTDIASYYFVEFLHEFFTIHKELLQNPFYLFGVSFAGHYIPTFAQQIFTNPKLIGLNINYKGIGIGDGWTVPFQQAQYFGSYLYSTGLIDNKVRIFAENSIVGAQRSILAKDDMQAAFYANILLDELPHKYAGNINQYNFQSYTQYGSDESPYIKFLDQYRKQFGVPDIIQYTLCNNTIQQVFYADAVSTKEEQLVFLLNKGRVILYNGQLDYIVNTPGALQWINNMKWDKIKEWKTQKKKLFTLDASVVGWLKNYQNFTFVTIYKAGHFVPYEQPEAAAAMLQHFLQNDQEWK